MASRLEYLRKLRGLRQDQLAARAYTTPSQIGKLERGERRLTADWQQRLARALDCAVSDLIDASGDAAALSVSIEWSVGTAFSAAIQPEEPFERLSALPGLVRTQECAAARVVDDSCDRLYPEGSMLIVRRAAHVEKFRTGAKILFRRRDPREILVGVLDRGATGDIVAHLRSTSRDVPAAVTIQPAQGAADPLARFGLADRFAAPISADAGEIARQPRDDDPAEILGLIVMAITPE
jgi:transcriptional regulator with XRE-family HTH domain